MKRFLTTLLLAGFALAGQSAFAQDKSAIEKIQAALPEKAPVAPKSKHRVLIYSKTQGFRHDSIPVGTKAFILMGDKTGAYLAEATEDESYFTPEKLKNFDAVIMLNTTGNCLQPRVPNRPGEPKAPKEPKDPDDAAKLKFQKDTDKYQADLAKYKQDLEKYNAEMKAIDTKELASREETYKKALHEFVLNGGGLMGTHSATDTYGGWKAYNKMMGGTFNGHPWHQKVPVKNLQPNHPLNAAFNGKDFEITDEIYQFRADGGLPEDRLFLLSLDTNVMDVKAGNRKDGLYPVSWVATYGKGRTFYCSLGHRQEIYWNPTMLQHYLAGLQYVLGDLSAPATETKDTEYQKK